MADAEGTAEKAPPLSNAGLAAGADRLRRAPQWLMGAAGAVATAVFAGITISGLNGVDGWHLGIAIAAAILALVSIIAALFTTMWLNGESTITTLDLTQPIDKANGAKKAAIEVVKKDPILRPWRGEFAEFLCACGAARKEHNRLQMMWVDDPAVVAESAFVSRAAARVNDLEKSKKALLDAASYIRLRHAFGTAAWWLGGLLTVTAISIVAFVWATGHSDKGRTPEISADIHNVAKQVVLVGTVKASGVSRSDHVHIRVYEAAPARATKAASFSADLGSDSSGDLKEPIKLSMKPTADHAIIKVWVGSSKEPRCDALNGRQSCAIVAMPPKPAPTPKPKPAKRAS